VWGVRGSEHRRRGCLISISQCVLQDRLMEGRHPQIEATRASHAHSWDHVACCLGITWHAPTLLPAGPQPPQTGSHGPSIKTGEPGCWWDKHGGDGWQGHWLRAVVVVGGSREAVPTAAARQLPLHGSPPNSTRLFGYHLVFRGVMLCTTCRAGQMIQGDAFFVRPCASCPTRVSTVPFYLGSELACCFWCLTPTPRGGAGCLARAALSGMPCAAYIHVRQAGWVGACWCLHQ